MRVLIFAIPYYFSLMGVELLLSRQKRVRLFQWRDTVSNISCGILSELWGLGLKTFSILVYYSVYTHLRFFTLPSSGWKVWVLAFLGVDLCYYWFHRVSHRSSFFWAFHVVHHQSEEYNLSVALRQSAFGALVSWIFYLPLAGLGVPVDVFVLCYGFNLLYQFWIHTRLINRLGPLEWVLNTPSHHRVHHGTNPVYLDKNYAGTLILWDKIFGSFTLEKEKPRYGISVSLNSWDPLWANLHVWLELYHKSKNLVLWREKLAVWFMPPDWKAPQKNRNLEEKPIDTGSIEEKHLESETRLFLHVFSIFLSLMVGSIFIIWNSSELYGWTVVLAVILITLAFTFLSREMETKSTLSIAN